MDINEAVDLVAAFYNEKERALIKTILAQKIQIESLTVEKQESEQQAPDS